MLRKVVGVGLPIFGLVAVVAMMVVASNGVAMPVLDTKGVIGNAQRDTLYIAVAVMSIVVVPVFLLVGFISWRYRATTKKRVGYSPEWTSNRWLETIWWGVPIAIIVVLSVITWQTSHSLDPYRPLESDKQPLKIQVVSLQWKWLFIYPDEGVASIGEMALPVDTPVEFTITSDAPMNSFWIPQLGGQIYAMSGMSTKLHLDAHEPGDYRGFSANLSGDGHSDMTFVAKARDNTAYREWIKTVRNSDMVLDDTAYESLRLPGKVNKPKYYKLSSVELYDSIIERYSGSHMMGGKQTEQSHEGHH